MRQNLKALILVWFSITCTMAQQSKTGKAEVTGKVIENVTNESLPFASVVLKDATQQLVEGVITNEEGVYTILDIPVGNYNLEVTYTGFKGHSQPLEIKENRQKINLKPILLLEETVSLDEVKITTEVSQVSLRLDKKVFKVGKDILSQSGSVTDVLGNVPSVAVDPSGTVQLRGNANVTILINGRRSGLTSAQALEQIPSDNVDRVEVITTPSARYDASGSAGIINIILKKNTKGGLTGQLRGVVGTPDDYRLYGSFSYKAEKFNFFANAGIRYTDYEGEYTKQQRSIRNNTTVYLDQREDQDRHDDGKLIYVGADYYLNKNNSITAAFFRNQTEDTDETKLSYGYTSATTAIDSILTTLGNSKEKRSYNQLEMNYTKTFAKEGRKLTFDLQYDFWDSTKKWNVRTQKETPIMTPISNLRTKSTNKNNDIVLQSDLVTPFGEKTKLEIGAKFENRHVTDGFIAEELVNDDYQLLDNLDNEIAYDERIIGGYVQYGSKIGKFSYLLGLRIEDTNIKIKDEEGSFNNTNTFTNLFPTLNLGYAIGENTNFQLSYSKRINRPSLWQLNPFSELEDFNARFFGNPTLKSAFTDAVELSLLQKGTKFTINPSIYYSYTTDDTQWYTTQNDDGVFVSTIINLDLEKRYGFELSASYNPLKWLSFNGDFNAYRFDQEGIAGTQKLDFSDETWQTSLSTRIKLKHGISIQSRFNHQGERGNAQSKRKSISYLNLGASKKLFKNRGNLIFNVSNVFDSRKTREEITGTDFFVNQMRSRNGARWSLSFVYKFNGKSGHKTRRVQRSNRN
ncbi:outer membrane receptor protein involved in Fe transport [Aquimarina sp. EL_43]|uniref:TonB-dependent receptor domain-containing protein n=1 Tax=unclassified Aquimarina TaxID=2627091 RepID=UPI0018CA3395|nr:MULTISPECIES: TonB-dependent receptor [unclassified Aquimarina]MBG6129590.1 outer membrane receptor protein involved in Fe transport [Aquimarina sp. EL_35]MBG6150655.1 outer membrane receptor protein involved in Fe transport [Aquimarina sp. EL_32]MBG6168037.1 outer membrane receptor protein involved in Fe transport [Aquimarina sp. EL_43]